MKTLFATCVFILIAHPALAWGPAGHQVVAHIAAMELTPKARSRISALLGGEVEAMMALNSTWADEIRDDRPQTSPWHFVNIEIEDLRYLPARDCARDDCVVAQITRDERILRGNTPVPAKVEALKFLIHFVGDVHQPLHAGEDHDRGGNAIDVRIRKQRTNLHHIWDDEEVAVQGHDPLLVAQSIDAEFTSFQKARLAIGDPKDWALDSASVAKSAIYERLPDRTHLTLNAAYMRAEAPFARLQLAKAGFRLGAMLNAIFR